MTSTGSELPRRRIVVGTAGQMAMRLLLLVLGLATAPVLARHLGPEGFGGLTLLLLLSSFVVVVGDFGLSTLAGQLLPALADGTRAHWLRAFWRCRWGVALAVTAASALAAAVALRGELRVAVLVALAGVPATLVTGAASALFGATLHPGRSMVGEGVGRLAAVAGTMAVVTTGGGITAVAAATTAGAWAGAACSLVVVGRAGLRGSTVDPGAAPPGSELLRRALPLACLPVLGLVYARVDAVVLAVVATEAELGLYGLMYRVLEAVLGLVAVGSALLVPAMTSTALPGLRSARLRRGRRALVAAFLPAPVAVAVCGVPVLELLGGGAYLAVHGTGGWGGPGPALACLMAALALMLVNTTNGAAMVAFDRADLLLRHFLVTIPANVALTSALAWRWSYVGAAVATLVTEVVALVWSTAVVRRLAGPVLLLETLGPVVAAGTTMALTMVATDALPLPVRAAAGGLAYLAVLGALGARRATRETEAPPEAPTGLHRTVSVA